MSVAPGTRLASYEILSAIGSGGMGEVYRARDTKLGRAVAIKTLPAAFVGEPSRLARFRREAQVLASLNHPHIAQIHGLEEADGVQFLVLELVDGESLDHRIARGAIPVDEALAIAAQIADALETAHEKGIIHRDLKPANVVLTKDGRAKVLDFGLARDVEVPGVADVTGSATLTSPALVTRVGVVLGTAAYMSPEQAKGLPADRRSDVWAFGCVLYEMLTAARVFDGVDWSLLPAGTPREVAALLRRCLQRDVRRRLQAIGDARIAIEEAVSSGAAGDSDAQRPRPSTVWLLAAGAAAAVLAGAAGAAVWAFKPSPPIVHPVTRFTIVLPPGQHLDTNKPALALSPDGSALAYVAAAAGGPQQIYLRRMERADSVPFAGTEGAVIPFFSPDGRWLGFFSGGKLKKIPTDGGVAQSLAEVVSPQGAVWTGRHTIVFASDLSVLLQVADEGGSPQPLTRFEPDEIQHSYPAVLPDGTILFSALSANSPSSIAVQRIDSAARSTLVRAGDVSMPRYTSGHLVYAQGGSVTATPLDATRVSLTGAAVPVVRDVWPATAMAQFVVSASGTLAYVPLNPVANAPGTRMVWVSRSGVEELLPPAARRYNQPRLSPDGRTIAVDIVEPPRMQVWLYDIARDTLNRFTFDGANRHAVWRPDGQRIAFMSDREGPQQIYWKRADGTGPEERLTTNAASTAGNVFDIPYSFSPDGRLLTSSKVAPTTGAEVWTVPIPESSPNAQRVSPQRVLHTGAADAAPQLSPDGRWLAYASDETGRREIYVQAFPGPGGKWQVSTDGGNEPLWNRNGRELFFRRGDAVMSVDVDTAAGFHAGKARVLFEGHYAPSSNWYARANYDIAPDGQRFLMLKRPTQDSALATRIEVVLNWSEELRR